mgnify:CR=1 FL=1
MTAALAHLRLLGVVLASLLVGACTAPGAQALAGRDIPVQVSPTLPAAGGDGPWVGTVTEIYSLSTTDGLSYHDVRKRFVAHTIDDGDPLKTTVKVSATYFDHLHEEFISSCAVSDQVTQGTGYLTPDIELRVVAEPSPSPGSWAVDWETFQPAPHSTMGAVERVQTGTQGTYPNCTAVPPVTSFVSPGWFGIALGSGGVTENVIYGSVADGPSTFNVSLRRVGNTCDARVDTDHDGHSDCSEIDENTNPFDPLDPPPPIPTGPAPPLPDPVVPDPPLEPIREIACPFADAASPPLGVMETVYSFADHGGPFAVGGVAAGMVSLACAVTEPEIRNEAAHDACLVLGGASSITGVLAVTNVWNPIGWGMGAISMGTGLASFGACLFDPPDPNYTVVAARRPRALKIPKGGPKPLRAAVIPLLRNATSMLEYSEVRELCRNRASGAHLAGATTWETRQRACAASAATHLAALFTAQKDQRSRITQALKTIDAPNPRLTADWIHARTAKVRAMTRTALIKGKASREQLGIVDRNLQAAISTVKVPRRAFDAINGKALRGALARSAKTFRELARSYGAKP